MREWINILENDILSPEEEDALDAASQATYERESRVGAAVKQMCQKEFDWEFDGLSYAVNYDSSENELHIKVQEEIAVDQLQRLKLFGDHIVVAPSSDYQLVITIKTHPGLDIPK